MRRAAPGPQVSTGRLRVDAGRAIAKLREYQLADRAAWVLEGIRAAVAAGATAIELRGDANDIWLGWHGTPLASELLPRLFDELVSPEPVAHNQHVRLLAAAVNSSLGMKPAYVDVYSISAKGRGQRARYTPEVLAEPESELGESRLRHVAVEDAAPPTEIEISTGMLVHLRRRVGFNLLSYWLGEPPELPLARAACLDIGVPLVMAVPLRLTDHVVYKRDAARDLVRVPLGEGLDGFVAITHAVVARGAQLEVAERGVVLARYGLDVLGFPTTVPVPVRVFLDADRLPTNASRSQVRRDVHPIASGERRALQVIKTALDELATLTASPDAAVAAGARRAALSLLASSYGGHPVTWALPPPLLRPLAALPLARNALGEARPIDTKWGRYIHTDRKPLDADLEPWLGEMLWVPPEDPVQLLLAGAAPDTAGARRHVRAARRQRRAHQKFLAHSKREIRVQSATYPRARVALGVAVDRSCVPQSLFADVTGEVCVYSDGQNGSVVLCVDGRELERVEWPTPIPFDAVIDSNRLTPGDRYRGVRRDDAYAAVTRAVRAGMIRAVETIALESAHVIETDMVLVRRAIAQARELGFELTGPLAAAGAWRTVTGDRVSYTDLKASQYIGVVGDNELVTPPRNRVIVHTCGDDREELRLLFGQRIVPYHRAATGAPRDLAMIADQLPRFSGAACLIVRQAELSGAIALSGRASLYWFHQGIALGEAGYQPRLMTCAIALDSDALVPNERWTGVVDDAGLGKQSFRDWEVALLCAIARCLLGDDVPDLVTPERVALSDGNAIALMTALANGAADPVELLGAPLYERLCAAPLFRRLGGPALVSIRELADANPHGIFYVDGEAQVVDDFAPVVATELQAKLIGKLGRRPVHDGIPELKHRQKRALKRTRLAEHLARPEQPLALVSEMPTVEFRGKKVRGILGIAPGMPEVRIRVEGRPFVIEQISIGMPLVAAVDLALSDCNDALDGVPRLVLEEVLDDMRSAVPLLLSEIANARPRLFGEDTPARTLLARFLDRGKLDAEHLELLRSIPAFETVQGEWTSIAKATDSSLLRTATFADDWLAPGDGEQPAAQDRPVLAVARPPDDLNRIFAKLHEGVVGDITVEVTRLQARRRMARGMLPTPRLPDIPAARKRALPALSEAGRKLGLGEIGFPLTEHSMLLVHEQGALQKSIEIDVLPAIHLAVEAPHEVLSHAQMRNLAQELAVDLVRVVLPELGDVPVALRRSLARAVLARRIPPVLVGTTPLFPRLDDGWLTWAGFESQVETFGAVWAVTTVPMHREPLDPERVVLLMTAPDLELAISSGHTIMDATRELELDAKARENRARPRATILDLPSTEGVLAEIDLPGDGVKSPRGKVAVLTPASEQLRGLYPHRDMQPLVRIDDPCRWPTVAIVDDARIVPDRTWSAPKPDGTWQSIEKDVRTRSEEALSSLGQAPADALADIRITNHVCADVRALRSAPRSLIRGVLWLTGVPYAPVNVVVRHRNGVRTFAAAHGIAVGGAIAVYTPDDLDLDAALEQLCGICHGKLVRAVLKDTEVDRDVVAAHVAHGLAVGTVNQAEIGGIKFDCFAPRPLEARALSSMFKRVDPVSYVTHRDPELPEGTFIDDGSEVAKVVRTHLGDRLVAHQRVRPKPTLPPPPMKPPVSTTRPAAPAASPPAPAAAPPPIRKKPHLMQPLLDALEDRVARAGIQTMAWNIAERAEPLVGLHGHQIVLAGDNPRLRLIASELLAGSVRAAPAIDAVAAHVISVLNIARTDITDATEMHALGVLLASPTK